MPKTKSKLQILTTWHGLRVFYLPNIHLLHTHFLSTYCVPGPATLITGETQSARHAPSLRGAVAHGGTGGAVQRALPECTKRGGEERTGRHLGLGGQTGQLCWLRKGRGLGVVVS